MTRCPTPQKRGYGSKRAAIAAAIGSSRTYATGMRTYLCACGQWHTTHRLPRWSRGGRS